MHIYHIFSIKTPTYPSHVQHILNALNGGTVIDHTRELLVTKYRQSFLQCQLKPVTASYSISSPVMKVFVADDSFYPQVVCITSCDWIS